MYQWIHAVLSRATAAVTTRDLLEVAVPLVLTALACLVYSRYPALLADAGARLRASASHANLNVLAAMLLPLSLRIALLPWVPPPEPHVHDEFGHLLVADTLAAGRLANAPHPLWRHLDTIYVLQRPTYSSVYPIGQGVMLAVGKLLFGKPWAGVLLSVVLMCGATSWMLFGCLPPAWAALGGLLAALSYGLSPQWIDSYWGGAFCAFGGALLFGALCRLKQSPSRRLALMAGVGWSVMWLIRPFESLVPLLFSWALVAAFILRDPRLWRRWLGPIGLILSIQMAAGCVTALHNRAVTGSFTKLPYHVSQQAYGVPQSFIWQKAIEEPALRFAEAKEMYRWQRNVKDWASARPFRRLGGVLYRTWEWFVTPWYSVPIVLLVFLAKDRQVVLAVGLIACALAVSALYPFFFPHYIAAYSCVVAFLIIRGMMRLFQWSYRGRVVGPLVVLFLLLGGLMMGLRHVPTNIMLGRGVDARHASLRERVSERLVRSGGRHVVFVRYGPNHSFHDEWVYNAADVDASPVVWCRASDPANDIEVARYYDDRQLWLADVDADSVRVSRYLPEAQRGISVEASGGDAADWVLEREGRREE